MLLSITFLGLGVKPHVFFLDFSLQSFTESILGLKTRFYAPLLFVSLQNYLNLRKFFANIAKYNRELQI